MVYPTPGRLYILLKMDFLNLFTYNDVLDESTYHDERLRQPLVIKGVHCSSAEVTLSVTRQGTVNTKIRVDEISSIADILQAVRRFYESAINPKSELWINVIEQVEYGLESDNFRYIRQAQTALESGTRSVCWKSLIGERRYIEGFEVIGVKSGVAQLALACV